jgi:hypothetical protein
MDSKHVLVIASAGDLFFTCDNPVAVSSNKTSERYEERTLCQLPAYLPASNYTVSTFPAIFRKKVLFFPVLAVHGVREAAPLTSMNRILLPTSP